MYSLLIIVRYLCGKYLYMTAKKKYDGYLLAANPGNPKDDLQRSVILLLRHADDVAVGLQINRQLGSITLAEVSRNNGIHISDNAPLWYGGDAEERKIHVIHSTDWMGLSSINVTEELAVTNDISVLAAISRGEGPEHFRACTGYWVWENGRMNHMLDPTHDTELVKWEILPATMETVFAEEGLDQWLLAIDRSAQYQTATWF
jgi:putative transcriptional regulator